MYCKTKLSAMLRRRSITDFVRPADGDGAEPPQEQRPEQIFDRQAQPTQHAASPAQLEVGMKDWRLRLVKRGRGLAREEVKSNFSKPR